MFLDSDELKGKTLTLNMRGRKLSLLPEEFIFKPGDAEADNGVSIPPNFCNFLRNLEMKDEYRLQLKFTFSRMLCFYHHL